jgi:hypothetical protein
MEVITEGVNNLNIAAAAAATTDSANNKKNRIQVSNTKKPLFFYVNLAKVLPNPPPFRFSKLVFFFFGFLFISCRGNKIQLCVFLDGLMN